MYTVSKKVNQMFFCYNLKIELFPNIHQIWDKATGLNAEQ